MRSKSGGTDYNINEARYLLLDGNDSAFLNKPAGLGD
jgi:hypothetical protein